MINKICVIITYDLCQGCGGNYIYLTNDYLVGVFCGYMFKQ